MDALLSDGVLSVSLTYLQGQLAEEFHFKVWVYWVNPLMAIS